MPYARLTHVDGTVQCSHRIRGRNHLGPFEMNFVCCRVALEVARLVQMLCTAENWSVCVDNVAFVSQACRLLSVIAAGVYTLQRAIASSPCPAFCVAIVRAPFDSFRDCDTHQVIRVKSHAVECLSTLLQGNVCPVIGAFLCRDFFSPSAAELETARAEIIKCVGSETEWGPRAVRLMHKTARGTWYENKLALSLATPDEHETRGASLRHKCAPKPHEICILVPRLRRKYSSIRT